MNKEINVRILTFPKRWIISGYFCLIGTTFMIALMIIDMISTGEIETFIHAFCACIPWLPFWFMDIYISVNIGLWQVKCYKEYFVYRNFFGVKKTYYYKDLTIDETKAWSKEYFYLNGKKVFVLPYFVEDGDIIVKQVKKLGKQVEFEDK